MKLISSIRTRNYLSHLSVLVAMVLIFVSASAPTPQSEYIQRWAKVAVSEMHRTGVPASITLAQGILESDSGQSKLASKGNNHFGIKCHNDWKGKTMKVDDDRRNECFRVYKTAEESFRDHSDFLRYRDRYKSLFDLKTTDYEAWAVGLKAAGYATDPSYANKLIKIIEDYNLSVYDTGVIPADVSVPESPSRITSPKIVKTSVSNADETISVSLTRDVFKMNGVSFVYSIEGESYQSIASSFGLFLNEILSYNDLKTDVSLNPGTVVYIQPKKKQAVKGMDKYIVEEDGESLRDICQKYAVKEKSVLKLNHFKSGHELRSGDTVLLRKVKK